ncbi:MAG: hypothetical protein ACR2JI_16450 [Mycobacterium sp.]
MTNGPRPGVPERGVWIPDPAQRNDLAVFAERVLRTDAAAVIRLRTRADGLVGAWAVTGFDVLVARAVTGRVRPLDVTCAADRLGPGLRAADATGFYDQGYSMDSAWRGGLPPETGFVRLDDVPAAVFADLARQGAELARESGSAHGPPTSLMDQEVLTVKAGETAAGVPMRCVLALEAMRFVPDPAPESEVVRVSVQPAWLRIDARFGSVFRRRGDPVLLMG